MDASLDLPLIHLQGPLSTGFGWFVGLALLFWLYSIVEVANRRTKDPFDRIVWLIVILALPVVGSLLYLFFSKAEAAEPPESREPADPASSSEEAIKRRANEGTLL